MDSVAMLPEMRHGRFNTLMWSCPYDHAALRVIEAADDDSGALVGRFAVGLNILPGLFGCDLHHFRFTDERTWVEVPVAQKAVA